MKKIFFISIIAGLFFVSCGSKKTSSTSTASASVAKTDLEKEGIFGNVVSVRQRVYWCLEKFGRFDKGKLQNLPTQDFLKVFDKDGFLVEETYYDAKDNEVNSRKLTYDSRMLTTEELYKGAELSEKIVYTYNDKKQLIKKEKSNGAGEIKEWNEYSYYEDSGLVQDEDLFNKDGKLSIKYVHIYEDALLVERQKYWGGGSLAQKEFYEYNIGGQLALVNSDKYQNKEASFEKRVSYSGYDAHGGYALKVEYDANEKELKRTTYVYDEYGNLTEFLPSVVKPEGTIVTAETEVVGEDGESEEESGFSESNETWAQGVGAAYTYEYDDKNNWTQKITYKIDTTSERVRQFYYERTFTYK